MEGPEGVVIAARLMLKKAAHGSSGTGGLACLLRMVDLFGAPSRMTVTVVSPREMYSPGGSDAAPTNQMHVSRDKAQDLKAMRCRCSLCRSAAT